MNDRRKNVIITILFIGMLISGLGNVLFSNPVREIPSILPPEKQVLVVGTNYYGILELDPVYAYDTNSISIITQVVETLFTNNNGESYTSLVNLLAESYTWINNMTLEITLKPEIIFHDGIKFNVSTVVWNYERMMFLSNITGELPPGRYAAYFPFVFHDDTLIINSTEIVSEYIIRFHLNNPFTPLLSLFAHSTSSMLSPKSTPFNRSLSIKIDDLLVGTGPYKYHNHIAHTEVIFYRWDGYWRELAAFDEMILRIIDNANYGNYAILAGDIDYFINPTPELFETYNKSPYVALHEIENPGVNYAYIFMNNERINITWRKAISYAINYTNLLEIVEKMTGKKILRANNPISPIFSDHNPDINLIEYNLTLARKIMVSMGFGNMGWNDTQWETARFISMNFTKYYLEPTMEEYVGNLLAINLKQIGINVTLKGLGLYAYSVAAMINRWNKFLNSYLGFTSVLPDYIDPYNILFKLFSNSTIYYSRNAAHINDPWVLQRLEEILNEINETKREMIYSDIQYYIVEDLVPHAFGYHYKTYCVHSADLYNVPYNAIGKDFYNYQHTSSVKFYAYPIKRNLSWSPY